MESAKTLLSIVPESAQILIWGPDGEFIAMQAGPAVGGTLAAEVIDILRVIFDTSQLSPETLHEFAELVTWEPDKIEVKWKR